MNSTTRWQRVSRRAKPGLKIAGKLALMTALRYGPVCRMGGEIRCP